MKKVKIYDDGRVFVSEGIDMIVNNKVPDIEVEVNEEEFKKLPKDPKKIKLNDLKKFKKIV